MSHASHCSPADWQALNCQIVGCERCGRLRDYCHQIAQDKRASFRDWDYWGRPVPNFGDPRGRLLVVGLAPAAHGANRTGRMFTGDRSGDWLYRALHEAGFANQATSQSSDDGLQLVDCAITAAAHCAPPGNKPSKDELGNCHEWFERTIDVMPVMVFLALGQIGWRALVAEVRQPRLARGAGAQVRARGPSAASGRPLAVGQLSSQPAEYVYRRAHQGNVRSGVSYGEGNAGGGGLGVSNAAETQAAVGRRGQKSLWGKTGGLGCP